MNRTPGVYVDLVIMTTTPTIKDRLAKAVGYDSDDRDDDVPSISNADLFIEHEPTVGEFLAEITPTLRDVGNYFYGLFPFIHWIGKYNVTWLIGDLVAGETVIRLARLWVSFANRSMSIRYYRWCSRRSSGNGICSIGLA